MKTGWSWQTHHIKLTGQIEDRWCLWFKITAPSLPQDTLSQTQKGHKHIKSLSNDNTACWTELTDIGRWKHRSKYKSNSIQCIQYKLHDRARTTSTMLNEIYFYISQHCIKTIISFEIKITLFLEDLPGHNILLDLKVKLMTSFKYILRKHLVRADPGKMNAESQDWQNYLLFSPLFGFLSTPCCCFSQLNNELF